jgi:hypothetical protein
VGFRYFIDDTSIHGDYVGLDSVVIQAPEPATIGLLAFALSVFGVVSRRRQRIAAILGVTVILSAAPVAAQQPTPAMRISRDPVTGKIQLVKRDADRTPPKTATAQEPPATQQVITGPGAAKGVLLGPEFQSYTVATRSADGRIKLTCTTGDQTAPRSQESQESRHAH